MKLVLSLCMLIVAISTLVTGAVQSTPACEEELKKAHEQIEKIKQDFTQKAKEKKIAETQLLTMHETMRIQLIQIDSLTMVIDSLKSR